MTRARDLAAFVSNADGDIKFDTDTLFIDSSANKVGINLTNPDDYYGDTLVVGAGSEGGITIAADANTHNNYLMFADGTSGSEAYRGYILYEHGASPEGMGLISYGRMRFYTSANGTTATERWRIEENGNLKAVQNGNGIDFSATEGSGASSSILDDYEEGLYTATITPSTSGSITVNSSYDTMSYTKIGRQVTVNGRIRVSAVSSPVGQMINVSLPFVIGSLAKESERAMPTVLVQNAAQDTSNYIGHPASDGSAFTQIGRSNSYGTNAAQDFDGNELVTITLTYFTD